MCPVALVLLYTAKDDVLIKRMREKSDSESEEMLKSKLEEYHMKSTPMVLFYQEKTKTVIFFFGIYCFLEERQLATVFECKENKKDYRGKLRPFYCVHFQLQLLCLQVPV